MAYIWTPSRVVLIARGRYDEGVLDADVWPGMLMARKSNGNYIPHNVIGGGGPLLVATEDVLRGKTIKEKLLSGDQAPFYHPARGDQFLMLLKNGQSVTNGDPLMSSGDGTLIAALGQGSSVLYEIVTPSTVITNTNTETAFSNGSYTVPANTLAVGDVISVRAKVFCISENSTNTHQIKLYMGGTPITIVDSSARQLAANDVVEIEANITVRTITASGTIIADGYVDFSISGTFTHLPFTLASSTMDSTVANPIVIKSTASATSATNQVRLDEYRVSLARLGSINTIVSALETRDNSGGTGTSEFNSAMFIRCLVP